MALPSGWYSQDIGSVGIAGSADYADSVYTLQGSGADIWGTADAFHFAYQPLNGNGTITARVASVALTGSNARGGVMIRENLDANASNALASVTRAEGMFFTRRLTTGGSTSINYGNSNSPPYWVRLTRADSTFTAYQSADGNAWTQIGSDVTINMATSVYVGLAVSAINNSALNTSTFDNVSLQFDGLTGLPRRALDGPIYGSLRGSVR